jgi:uncharacterized membrane protein
VPQNIELKLTQSGPASSIEVRNLNPSDLVGSLGSGWDDFMAYPSHAVMLAIIYPIVGLLLAPVLHGYSFLPLLFPLAAGFALIGPLAAVVFYDLSRQRERGMIPRVAASMDMIRSSSLIGIGLLGVMLAALFLTWVATAQSIYNAFFGFAPVFSMPGFFRHVVGTTDGRMFLLAWSAAGSIFAIVAFSISVVSFPALIDRRASATDAVLISLRVIARNPLSMMLWGLIVAAALAVAIIPFFLGLAIVVPVLGHATWHLYRRAVSGAGARRWPPRVRTHRRRYLLDAGRSSHANKSACVM